MEQEDIEFLEYRRQLVYYLNLKKFTDPTDFISMSRVCDILRILHYKVLKFACPTQLTEENLQFIKLIEFILPQATIEVSEDRIRHKTCECVCAEERQDNMRKAVQLVKLLNSQPSNDKVESDILATMPDSELEPDCYDEEGSPVYLDDLDEDGYNVEEGYIEENSAIATLSEQESDEVIHPSNIAAASSNEIDVPNVQKHDEVIHQERNNTVHQTSVQAASGWQLIKPIIITEMPTRSGLCESKWDPSPTSSKCDGDDDFVEELSFLLKRALVKRGDIRKLRTKVRYKETRNGFVINTSAGTLCSDFFETPTIYHLGVSLFEKNLIKEPGELQYISALYLKHRGIWKPNVSRPPDIMTTGVLRHIPINVAELSQLLI